MKCPVCKKNISGDVVRCPHCNSRIGIICTNCNTVNPVGNLTCANCNQELLKICSRCNSVNFPNAEKCRKCGSPFQILEEKSKDSPLTFVPQLVGPKQALNMLIEGIQDKDKKIFSITGDRGIGKSYLLKSAIKNFVGEKWNWCIGKCTPLTQLTPGGVIQDMLLNLFKLPNYCLNSEEFKQNAIKFFSNEFKFLNSSEVDDYFNFIYTSQDGHYEDIIINKRRTFSMLYKIFDALCHSGKVIFVVDNFDFIDGFSIEFLTHFVSNNANWKNLKIILLYNEHKPVTAYFPVDNRDIKSFLDIHMAPMESSELEKAMTLTTDAGTYVTKREKDVIFEKCKGNPAFVEQAISYCFDCQIADKAFLMPKTFKELISERLETLKKINKDAYRMLCGASILGDKLNLILLKEIFGYKNKEFNEIISYLVKANFVKQYSDVFYEFNNLFLWETILTNIQKDECFEDVNVKVGRALSLYTLNTNAAMAMIAHNLKENRMAFDIWTRTTRLAAYVGDINLYVIAQKQCLALLNEFNENETLNIRYNISERLGKLLTEYDPEEAIEFLPDAISNAKSENNDTKEIELLGYLAVCCKKTGKYYGDIECTDNVLKKLLPSQELESAMIKASKLASILNIGNCGEAVDIIEHDILPVINSHLIKPSLSKAIPLGLVHDTKVKCLLYLATALALEGNDRAFEVLSQFFEILEKNHINDPELYSRAKLVLAYANTMKGNFQKSEEVLHNVLTLWSPEISDLDNLDEQNGYNFNNYSLISIINDFLQKEYSGIQDELYDAAKHAQDSGNEFYKNLFKTFLGKFLCDARQAKRAIEIYNEQVTYFANKKLAFGALLCWYLIAEASIIIENPKNAIEVASQALEIAQNPRINNLFFVVLLRSILAKAYIELSDYETAKINLESALALSKKYNMNDLASKIYLLYGAYYQEIGTISSQNQLEYLKGANKMYDRALELVMKNTKNAYIKDVIEEHKRVLYSYSSSNGLNLQ